jgi:hypothetical protein
MSDDLAVSTPGLAGSTSGLDYCSRLGAEIHTQLKDSIDGLGYIWGRSNDQITLSILQVYPDSANACHALLNLFGDAIGNSGDQVTHTAGQFANADNANSQTAANLTPHSPVKAH